METQSNNDEQTKETLPNYYGWYSQKMKNIQNDNIDFKSTLNNNKNIYYKCNFKQFSTFIGYDWCFINS